MLEIEARQNYLLRTLPREKRLRHKNFTSSED